MATKRPDRELDHIIHNSGFPLQVKIAHEVNRTREQHGWNVLAEEHPWTDPATGTAEFLDIVLAREVGIERCVVDCKKKKPGTKWVFFTRPEEQNRRLRVGWSYALSEQGRRLSRGRERPFGWADVQLDRDIPVASFCSLEGTGPNRPGLIENDAAKLVRSVQVVANEEATIQDGNAVPFVYLPVIITTAELYVCEIDHDNVSLATGRLEKHASAEVDVVHFRKPLSDWSGLTTRPIRDLREANSLRHRSVMVVKAASTCDFLLHHRIKPMVERWPWSIAVPAHLL